MSVLRLLPLLLLTVVVFFICCGQETEEIKLTVAGMD